MPIDEQLLEKTIIDLGIKAQQLLEQRQELIDEQTRLQNIRIIKKPQFDPDTGAKTEQTKDVKPKNEFTGIEITDEERQKIFDTVMPRATNLLKK